MIPARFRGVFGSKDKLDLPGTVQFLRGLGFFPDAASDADAIARVRQHYGVDFDEALRDAKDPGARDMFLLWADTARVWCRDLECVYRGENAYVETLREWSSISRGVLSVSDAREEWKGDDGPVEVSFVLRGERELFVHRGGDFIEHLELKRLLNLRIADTGIQIEAGDNYPGDSRLIVFLRSDEKKRLRKRGWRFL